MSQDNELDFDILDSSIDELADLQDFKPFPAGTYACIFDWETKNINGAAVVEFKFALSEVIELANADEESPKDKATTSISAFLTNQDGSKSDNGQGLVKKVASAMVETFGGSTTRETLDATKGGKVAVTFGVRTVKKDGETKHYQKLLALMPS